VKTRTSKAVGAVAGIAAIALSIPLAVNAYADPPAPPEPVEVPYPDLQGSGCDAFKTSVPNYKSLANLPVSQVLASIPDISTFNAAVSGGFNPSVNIEPVLDNGPYVVFAPTDQAFGELPPQQLDALKADPAALFDFDYYHVFLGLLGVDDVHGQRPTQQGAEIKVDGKGGDIKINGTAKVLCGAIQAQNARIYLIDTVLDKSAAPEALTPSGTSTTSTTTTTTTTTETTPTTAPEAPPAAPMPAADAPIG
jgi:uncharacterized surface protein with fasciclin (FAS1) repeats